MLRTERIRIEAVGTARAHRSITLHPATAGEVAAVLFSPGEEVGKGRVLLELDSRRPLLVLVLNLLIALAGLAAILGVEGDRSDNRLFSLHFFQRKKGSLLRGIALSESGRAVT